MPLRVSQRPERANWTSDHCHGHLEQKERCERDEMWKRQEKTRDDVKRERETSVKCEREIREREGSKRDEKKDNLELL